LLYDYAVSYSYSSTLFQQVYAENQARGKKKLAAFAPEYSKNTAIHLSDDGRVITRQKYRKNLYPIPGVLEEIEEISKIAVIDIFTGQEASETTFRRVAGKYDLLHLAMHTVVDNNNPMFSKLIFSDTPDSTNDGLLNTFEIFGLRLRARMVVLSACSTGEGDYSNGEGVMSLARGFVYAGSPSLIMTMWEIEDKTSILLMKRFYQNLFKGQNKAKALQEAKIEFIRQAKPENTHPFFWSSYVVLGNTRSIAWKPGSIILLVIVSLVSCTVLGIVAFKFFRKRSEHNR
jgi:CHAT domain-containing protein